MKPTKFKTELATQLSIFRKVLKQHFPEFKFSLVKTGPSNVSIALIQGPEGILENGKKYENVNHYHLDNITNPTKRCIFGNLKHLVERHFTITYRETGEYGNQPNLYVEYSIGDWNKDYNAHI